MFKMIVLLSLFAVVMVHGSADMPDMSKMPMPPPMPMPKLPQANRVVRAAQNPGGNMMSGLPGGGLFDQGKLGDMMSAADPQKWIEKGKEIMTTFGNMNPMERMRRSYV